MKRARIHSSLLLAGITLSLCVFLVPAATSSPNSSMTAHEVVPASDAKPLPDPPDVIITTKRRVVHRIDTRTQGVLSSEPILPERRPQYRGPDCVIDSQRLYVFIPYLPRDPPIA